LKLNTVEMGKPFCNTTFAAFDPKRLNIVELGKIYPAPEVSAYPAYRVALAF